MEKKVFKIRHKPTGQFWSHHGKTNWFTFPSQVIKHNPFTFGDWSDWEVVVFKYELIETTTEPLR